MPRHLATRHLGKRRPEPNLPLPERGGDILFGLYNHVSYTVDGELPCNVSPNEPLATKYNSWQTKARCSTLRFGYWLRSLTTSRNSRYQRNFSANAILVSPLELGTTKSTVPGVRPADCRPHGAFVTPAARR